MLDFLIESGDVTLGQRLFVMLLYTILLVYGIRKTYPELKEPMSTKPMLFGMIFFAVFDFLAPDFWNYIDQVEAVWVFDYSETLHMEAIYQFFVFSVGGDYFLFRLIVWGGMLLIFVWACKRLKANVVCALTLLLIFFYQFASSRANLGIVIYFLGLTYLLEPIEEHHKRSYLIGLALILSSSFFHSTMFLLILFTPIVFIPKLTGQAKKILLVIAIIMGGLIFYVMQNPYEFLSMVGSTSLLEKFVFYTEVYDDNDWGTFTGGISGAITFAMRELRMIVPVVVMLFIMRKHSDDEKTSSYVTKTFNIILLITLAAYFVRLTFPAIRLMSLRMMYMTYPAIALIIAKMHTEKQLSKLQLILLTLFPLLDTIYESIYRFYGGW